MFKSRSENIVVAKRVERLEKSLASLPYLIDFKKGGNAEEHKLFGWSYPERDGSWTRSDQVALGFAFDPMYSGREVEVRFEFWLVRYMLDSQQMLMVEIQAGDENLEPWIFRRGEDPAKVLRLRLSDAGEPLILWLAFSGLKSPADLGTGGDRRLLGFAVSSVAIELVDNMEGRGFAGDE